MAKLNPPQRLVDDGLAIRIGELLCDALYGDLSRQQPLFATDKETCWRVEGNWNRDGIMEGLAEFFLSIAKSDGRVTDVGEVMRVEPHPSIAALFGGPEVRSETERIHPEMTAQCMVLLNNLGRGSLIFSEDLAIKLGEAFCQAHYGDLQRQAPLTAADKETYWRVEGNWNRDGKLNGTGPFFVSIEKYDGRVTEIGE
jgi:hypothetical protein